MRLVIERCQSRDLGLRLARVRVFVVDLGLRRKMSSENAAFFLILNFVGGGPVGPGSVMGLADILDFIYVPCLSPRSSIIILRLDLVSKEEVKRVYLGTKGFESGMCFWFHIVFLRLPCSGRRWRSFRNSGVSCC